MPYRDPNLEQLVRAMGEAARTIVDAEYQFEQAQEAAQEAERRLADARRRHIDAADAYRKVRWP